MFKTRKTNKFFSALLAIGALVLVIGGGVTANADSGPGTVKNNLSGNGSIGPSSPITDQMFEVDGMSHRATAKSTAQFTVKGGQLFLAAVPDFNFGMVDAKTVLNGGKKDLENNTVKKGGTSKENTAWDGNDQGKLVVFDRRGTTGGWNLELSMGTEFNNGTTNSSPYVSKVTMDLKAIGHDSSGRNVSMGGTGINDMPQTIVYNTSGGATAYVPGDIEFNLNPTSGGDRFGHAFLSFSPQGTNAVFSTDKPYQSDLTWTLVAGA